MDTAKLISFENYSKIKHDSPYFYTIKNPDGREIYYFGEKHSHDPLDPQWIEVKKFWSEFLKSTENHKRMTFIENKKPPLEETEEKTIHEYGGPGFINLLASQSGINVLCPEPNRMHEIRELEKHFSREEIEYYYFARVIHQWWRIPDPKPDLNEYIMRYLKRDEKVNGWSDFEFSIDNMKNIHKNIFDKEFDGNEPDFFRSIVSPANSGTVINEVARLCSNFRNEYILKEIRKYWDAGNSIYIQYGASHAVMQEPVLRDFMNN